MNVGKQVSGDHSWRKFDPSSSPASCSWRSGWLLGSAPNYIYISEQLPEERVRNLAPGERIVLDGYRHRGMLSMRETESHQTRTTTVAGVVRADTSWTSLRKSMPAAAIGREARPLQQLHRHTGGKALKRQKPPDGNSAANLAPLKLRQAAFEGAGNAVIALETSLPDHISDGEHPVPAFAHIAQSVPEILRGEFLSLANGAHQRDRLVATILGFSYQNGAVTHSASSSIAVRFAFRDLGGLFHSYLLFDPFIARNER